MIPARREKRYVSGLEVVSAISSPARCASLLVVGLVVCLQGLETLGIDRGQRGSPVLWLGRGITSMLFQPRFECPVNLSNKHI